METGERTACIVVRDWWKYVQVMEHVKMDWKEQDGVVVKKVMLE